MAMEVFSANPEVQLALLKYLARTVRLLSRHLDDMAFLRTDQRIAQYLLSAAQGRGGALSCTQEEIADTVSASRVTVCRILNRFQRAGLVRTGYGSLEILDPTELRRVLEN